MSQTNSPDVNGPSDIAPRRGSQEGVNVTPGNITRQQIQHQGPYNQQLPSPQQQFGPRPLLRKNDSRSSIVTRPAGPFINQPPQQIGNIRQPPISSQPRPPIPGPNFNTNPLSNPPPRYPSPHQQPPARYGLYEHVPAVPGQDGNFRRAVNTVTENQIRFQRPPPPPGVRPPGLYPQKSLPPQAFPPSTGGVLDQNIRKPNNTLENSDVSVVHSAVHEQNGTPKTITRNTMEPPPTHDNKQKYDDVVRSSSSMGHNQDMDKDIDTSSMNGKETNRDDVPERPESKTGFLSRDHSAHSSMQKIDEDDDDAVVTPSRMSHHSGTSGSLRSGKATPISNSNDNISQKSIDLGNKYPSSDYSEVKKSQSPSGMPSTEPKYYANSPKPPNIGSTENLTTKSPDLTNQSLAASPKQMFREEVVRSQTPQIQKIEQTKNDALQMKNDKNLTQPQDFTRTKIIPSPQNEYKSSVSGRRPTSAKSQGDNDSGVDESTQGNDRSFNGEKSSPRKTPSKVSSSKLPSGKCKTPVKMLHSPKSPDPSHSVPASADKKKLPMNKIQVGAAPSPNIKTVKSKIGSLDNTSYKPGGGKVKLENRKIDFSKVQPRIAAKNEQYQPGGGDKKIQQQKLQWTAKSKIGSLDNATYRPGGGDKKIETVKLDFKDKAKPKVGSKDNIKHVPGGGDVKSIEEEQLKDIETKKLDLNVQKSKVGSLDNVKHKPGGGDIKIFDDKEYLRQKSGEQSVLSGSQSSLRSQPEPSEPVSDENLNQER